MLCKYEINDEVMCKEKAYKNHEYCILHIELPNESDPSYPEIIKLKKEKIEKKLENSEKSVDGYDVFNFIGAKLDEIDLSGRKINGSLDFSDAYIKNDVILNNSEIFGDVFFARTKIGGFVYFENLADCRSTSTKIHGDVIFFDSYMDRLSIGHSAVEGDVNFSYGTKIKVDAKIVNSNISGDVSFNEVRFGDNEEPFWGHVDFQRTKIGKSLLFEKSSVGFHANFYNINIKEKALFSDTIFYEKVDFRGVRIGGRTSFDNSKFKKQAFFDGTKIEGQVSFDNTTFGSIKSQEDAYLMAKTVFNNLGDRIEADKYFFKEMVAKRKQKPFYIKYPELIIEYCFGYGVYPLRIIVTWLIVVFVFALIFWLGNGVQDANTIYSNIYFSVVTALTPGYGGFKPIGDYQLIATIEAIFGTFMWAAFVATFARKYMR